MSTKLASLMAIWGSCIFCTHAQTKVSIPHGEPGATIAARDKLVMFFKQPFQ